MMKLRLYAYPLLLMPLLLAVVPAKSSRFGRDGFSGNPATNNGAMCIACHAPGAALPTVTLSGPMAVDAGGIYDYTVLIEDGAAQTAGVDISVSDGHGVLLPADANLQTVGQELSHTMPVPFAAGKVSFSFRWRAPDYNTTVTFYTAGNAANGELDLLDDGIASDTLAVTVQNGTGSPPPSPLVSPPAEATLELIANGLDRPVVVTHAGDERLFIVEQAGRIRIIDANGFLLPTPFLDISGTVDDTRSEQGLLGLAFHPDYQSNGYFFVNYIVDPGPGQDRTRISRFKRGSDPDLADPGSERILLEFDQPFNNHNGGDMHFGPDGYLYIASGDGGSGGDPENYAQNPNVLLGKMLRIDVDGAGGGPDCDVSGNTHYGIPPNNAFTDGLGGQGCDEIWALGLRNPWRFSFDRQTGGMWIADVGQSAFEEIDFVAAANAGGLNFGWRCYEGDAAFNTGDCHSDYLLPVYVAAHADGDCSITGGFVYRGTDYPDLVGRYLFTDFCKSSIRTLSGSPFAPEVDVVVPASLIRTPVAFGEDHRGELYVASLDGSLYRIHSTSESLVIGETAQVKTNQPSPTVWHTVEFENSYTNPVVVMGPPSSSGRQPMTVRIRNIRATGFEFQFDEWDYLDQNHTTEAIGYLVLEAGDHRFADGTRISAGLTAVDHQWRQVDFDQPFATAPIMLVQTSSDNGSQAVTERLRNIFVDGFHFQTRLQEEEANDGSHILEQLGWVAITPGIGETYEAVRLNEAVGHRPSTFALTGTYDWTPVVVADIQTFLGNNAATLRLHNVTDSSLKLHVEEEKSKDKEIKHIDETVGYTAFPEGTIKGETLS